MMHSIVWSDNVTANIEFKFGFGSVSCQLIFTIIQLNVAYSIMHRKLIMESWEACFPKSVLRKQSPMLLAEKYLEFDYRHAFYCGYSWKLLRLFLQIGTFRQLCGDQSHIRAHQSFRWKIIFIHMTNIWLSKQENRLSAQNIHKSSTKTQLCFQNLGMWISLIQHLLSELGHGAERKCEA